MLFDQFARSWPLKKAKEENRRRLQGDVEPQLPLPGPPAPGKGKVAPAKTPAQAQGLIKPVPVK